MQTVRHLVDIFRPEHYTLSLTIERTKRSFSGTVSIEGTQQIDGPIVLHAKDLELYSIRVNNTLVECSYAENDEVELAYEAKNNEKYRIECDFSGTINDQMHGMYPCYYEHEGEKKELIATQFESHHAREVFPCIDEPAAKATYDVSLSTEQGVTVLGNMPVKQQSEANNTLVTVFERTPKMSSYLLAWVVGEMHKQTSTTSSGVEVNVWATPAQRPESLTFALDIAVRTIEFFDDYFGVPYPLPKSDHVALPDFSSGAMENWGLITYREVALIADPETAGISSKRYIATVVAHELSHQWFGNLVTMKWWNNLWLNESFANLMEYIAIDALHPEWNIWLEYSSHETIMALRRDAIDGVQAVQTEVAHPDEISTLFDGAIVYAKGGRLLRMLQHYIGAESFRAGLSSYFKKYSYSNTEGDDLWNELSKASGKDVAGFMHAWISQPGYPVVHVTDTGLSQEHFFVGEHAPSSTLWPIPLFSSDKTLPTLLDSPSLSAVMKPGERLNNGDNAHFITHYAKHYFDTLIEKLQRNEFSELDRLQFLHEQTMLARGAVTRSADLVPLLDAYRDETSESVWDIISLAIGELKKFVESDETAEQALRELSAQLSKAQYDRLGSAAKTGESDTDTRLRATVFGLQLYGHSETAIASAGQLFDTSPLSSLDPELRGLIIGAVVKHRETPELVRELLKTYRTSASPEVQSDICSGLTSTKNPETISLLLETMQDSSIIRSQDTFRWFIYLVRNRYGRTLAWNWLRDNWDWVEKTYGGDKSFDDFPRYAASALSTSQQLSEYREFFSPLMALPALKRVITLGIAEISARVDIIERDQEAVKTALLHR